MNDWPRSNPPTYRASIAGATHFVVRFIARRQGWGEPNSIPNRPP